LIFHRTPSGLSNLHLFYEADAVVFVEGGENYSLLEITQGKYNPHSHDVKFWATLFSHLLPTKRCHFRAVGSKASLVALVEYVLQHRVQRVFVCMDRDLDHLTSRAQIAPTIVRTLGYSWENCVWTKEVVLAAFRKFNTSDPDTSQAEEEIADAFTQAATRLRWFVFAYCILVLAGSTSIDIGSALGAVTRKPADAPKINRKYLLKMIRLGHSTAGRVHLKTRIKTNTLLDCYGHLIGRFGYHLLAYLLRKYCGVRTFPIDTATPVAIDSAVTMMQSSRAEHYSTQLARLPWDLPAE
jgi:hypothetical protein